MGTLVLAIFLTSCASTGRYDTQKGALAGAGIGALAGQAIGRNTKSTLIGAGAGGLIGAILGDSEDQKNQEIRDRQRTQAMTAPIAPLHADAEPPPGRWITVRGRWNGNTWILAHKRWIPVNPEYPTNRY
ncbi:MAG: glycine zipper 2TM domain-containing protein [Proteobacteria bacterium]|nr:glycine zipper 2TM domain-containing protein [Pseudomonadota bacterium]MBU1696665.1 glycine zipper 2TM domain-containing protein [Pseudomonadota bacterium]